MVCCFSLFRFGFEIGRAFRHRTELFAAATMRQETGIAHGSIKQAARCCNSSYATGGGFFLRGFGLALFLGLFFLPKILLLLGSLCLFLLLMLLSGGSLPTFPLVFISGA